MKIKMYKMWSFILELIFPSRGIDKAIREITADEFMEKAELYQGNEFEDVRIVFNYKDNLVKRALWQLKYMRNRELAKLFAEIIYGTLLEELSELEIFQNFEKPYLVPIPISKKRLRERGFNQMELVARELSILDDGNSFKVALRILEKVKETPSQTSLTKAERMKNLKGSFALRDKRILEKRNIILLDDVITTGSTIEEAKRVLYEVGVKNIYTIVIAH
jgi:ComF family protein